MKKAKRITYYKRILKSNNKSKTTWNLINELFGKQQSTNDILLGLVRKYVVHFYTDFTSWLLKKMWLYLYPYWFCNPVRIHGTKIKDTIWWEVFKKKKAKYHVFAPTHEHKPRILFYDKLVTKVKGCLFRQIRKLLSHVFIEYGCGNTRCGNRLSFAALAQGVDVTARTTSRDVRHESPRLTSRHEPPCVTSERNRLAETNRLSQLIAAVAAYALCTRHCLWWTVLLVKCTNWIVGWTQIIQFSSCTTGVR